MAELENDYPPFDQAVAEFEAFAHDARGSGPRPVFRAQDGEAHLRRLGKAAERSIAVITPEVTDAARRELGLEGR